MEVGLKKAGLRDISLSLDTLDEKKYTFITGKNVFKEVLDSIALVKEILKNGAWLINCVVSRLNFRELPQILRFAEQNHFLVSLVPIENPKGRFSFSKQDYDEIDSIFENLLKNRQNIFNSENFLRLLKEYLKGNFKNFPCYAGKLYFSINPEGQFNICHKYRIEYKPSNIDFKNYLIENCSGCLRPCWREVDFVFKNSFQLFRIFKFYWDYL